MPTEVDLKSPQAAIHAGVGLLPEDRKQQGLFLRMSVRRNIAHGCLRALSRAGFVRPRAEQQAAEQWVKQLNVRTPSIEQQVGHLSGGNQQKVVLAKWLATEPKVLLLDEPTRGIDINAKREIFTLIDELARSGLGVVMVSSELPEILGLADRIMVLCEGRQTAEFERGEATEEMIVKAALPEGKS